MDMCSVALTGISSTYPAFVSNWNIGFALTARHFCQTATKVPKKALPHRTALASLRCPSLRPCSVGPPSRAILGPSRLSRHPCRSTHSTEPPFGLPEGEKIKNKIKTRSKADQKPIKSRIINPHLFCARLGIEPECPILLIEAMAPGPRLTPTVC